jgi:hypothetical protein
MFGERSGKTKQDNDIRLFKCMICQQYKSMSEHRLVRVKDRIFPQDVCATCLKDIFTPKSENLSGHESVVEKR